MSAAGGTAAYDILITGSNNSIAGNTTFANTGQLTIGDAANDVSVFTGGLTATTQSAGFGAGFVRSAGGVVNLGTVTFTAASTVDTTNNGAVAAGANLTLGNAIGGQNLTLVGGTGGVVTLTAATVANLTVTAGGTTGDIVLGPVANSINATGTILLQGATAATTIGVGTGATGILNLSDTDLAAINSAGTTPSLTIGQAAQTGAIEVGTVATTVSFKTPVTIQSTSGSVQVKGDVTNPGNNVTLNGGNVSLTAAKSITTTATANSGTASGAVTITTTGTGTITLAGNLVTTGAANNAGAGSAGGNVAVSGATGAVTISGNITATGGAGTRVFAVGGENGGAGGDIAISATTGNISVTGAVNTLGGDASNGEGGMGGDLSLATTTGTIGLGNISTSGGASTATNFDGGDAGTITISSTGGSAVTLNSSTIITASGGTAGGGIGVAGNGAAITFNNPVLLATGAASITTTGASGGNIIFNNTVNSASTLTPQSLTLSAGTGTQAGIVTFAGIVGGSAALTDLDVTAKTIQLNTTSISVDAGAVANTVSLTGAVTLGANVSLDLDGALVNTALTVTGTVDSASSLVARNLTVVAGASTDGILSLGNVTVSGAVGGTAPLGNITVTGAGTLTSGTVAADNVTFTGDLTATANTMTYSGTEVRSTGGGTITFAPTTTGNGILLGNTPVVAGYLDLYDVAEIVYTSGRFVVGSASTGPINVGTANFLSNGFSGFSLATRGTAVDDVTFDSGATLTLPSATDIRVSIGSGDVVGSTSANNLVATAGTVRFTAGAVTIGTKLANLQTTTTQNGFVLANSQSLNVLGAQRAGAASSASANTSDYLAETTAGNLTLASGTTFTAQDITLVADENLYNNAGSSPFTNQNGGRTLVYSTQAIDNQPPTANGGFSGFGAVFNTSANITTTGATGTYTINNSLPSGNLMVFSGPPAFPLIEPGTSTYNDLVNVAVYQATVPILGYSLSSFYTGQIRMGFKSGGGGIQNSMGSTVPGKTNISPEQPGRMKVGKVNHALPAQPLVENKPANSSPGRLRVSQLVKEQAPKAQVGSMESPSDKPAVRAGNVSLRMSGEFYPFELAEVTIGSAKVSQSR